MSETKTHRLISGLKGPVPGDTQAYLKGQVDAVAAAVKAGGMPGIAAKRSRLEKQVSQLDRKKRALQTYYDFVESLAGIVGDVSPSGIVADAGALQSKMLRRAIKAGKTIWLDHIERPELAGRIALAQKFKISTDVPNEEYLYDFGKNLEDEGLLCLPFEQMYIEYKDTFGDTVLQMAMFVDGDLVYPFIKYRDRWVCLHSPEADSEQNTGARHRLVVFLVLLASRSTEVTAIGRDGAPMKAVEHDGPSFSHHVVRLGLPRCDVSSVGGHHSSPRLHWRRGHIRSQHHGPGNRLIKKIWIAPVLVGDSGRGIVTHDYRLAPRQ